MRRIISIIVLLVSYILLITGDGDDNSKLLLPRLGLGTAGLRARTTDIVVQALDYGVRLIDTAQAYEWYDEDAVGIAVEKYLERNPKSSLRQNPIIIVTKIHPRSFEYHKMYDALHKSMISFQSLGKIDVVLLHAPRCWEGQGCSDEERQLDWRTGWKNLEKLKKIFSIDLIGVSNFHIHEFEELVDHYAVENVDVIQNWMDPFHQDREVRSFAEDKGIQYMAYSSFGTQWQNSPRIRQNPLWTNEVLRSVAQKASDREGRTVSVAEIVMSWLFRQNVVLIPRTSKSSHLAQNYEICSNGNELCQANREYHEGNVPLDLPLDEIEAISLLDHSLGDLWD